MITPTRLAAAAAALVLAAAAQATESRFDTGTQGWTSLGDNAGPVTWAADGGNPDGHVRVRDQASGAVIYFVAPAAYLGDQRAALNQTLAFDLMQIYSGSASQFSAADVVLVGASRASRP